MLTKLGKKLANVSLRTMVVTLVVLILLLFGIAQLVLIKTIDSNAVAARQAYVEDRAEQLRAQTELLVDNITSTANELAFNSIVLKFVEANRMREKLLAYNRIQVLLESVDMANPSIENAFLTDFDNVHFGNTETQSFTLKKNLVLYMKDHGWPNSQIHLLLESNHQRRLVSITPSLTFEGKRLYIVISYVLDNINTLLKMTADSERSKLLDREGALIFSYGQAEVPTTVNVINARSRNTRLGWHWEVTDTSTGVGQINQVTLRFVLALDAVLAGALLLFLILHDRAVIRPIAHLIRFLDSNTDGQGKTRLNMASGNEIGHIAQEIDHMLDGMERANTAAWNAQQNVYDLKIARQQARFNALQSQINPHFLYNTLECVCGIAVAHGVEEILDICTSMADIFRYSIKGSEYVRLKDELGIIQEYMSIMQIRQNNRYQVEINVPEEALEMLIPRMILQPVVENAVFHGLERIYHTPRLRVDARLKNEGIELMVCDNGVGMSDDALSALRVALKHAPEEGASDMADKDSIGLVNINDRIRLTCGEEYGLRIESKEGKGTSVMILLPYMNNMNKD